MNQAMLLAVTLGGDQNSFALLIFDASQLHSQIANKVRAVEYVTDLIFHQFIHEIPGNSESGSDPLSREWISKTPSAAGSRPP
jgi:hypothetical protein